MNQLSLTTEDNNEKDINSQMSQKVDSQSKNNTNFVVKNPYNTPVKRGASNSHGSPSKKMMRPILTYEQDHDKERLKNYDTYYVKVRIMATISQYVILTNL